MKPIVYLISIVILFAISLSSCLERETPKFYLSEDAKAYKIDTSVSVFNMIDNYGISDQISIVSVTGVVPDEESNGKFDPDSEDFMVEYNSSAYNNELSFYLSANSSGSNFSITWGSDFVRYNFDEQEVIYGSGAQLAFYDTMTVKGVVYNDIIEIDSKNMSDRSDMPEKVYYAATIGLIKYEVNDSIYVERLP
jgi:hypothetical protein